MLHSSAIALRSTSAGTKRSFWQHEARDTCLAKAGLTAAGVGWPGALIRMAVRINRMAPQGDAHSAPRTPTVYIYGSQLQQRTAACSLCPGWHMQDLDPLHPTISSGYKCVPPGPLEPLPTLMATTDSREFHGLGSWLLLAPCSHPSDQ